MKLIKQMIPTVNSVECRSKNCDDERLEGKDPGVKRHTHGVLKNECQPVKPIK